MSAREGGVRDIARLMMVLWIGWRSEMTDYASGPRQKGLRFPREVFA